MRFLSLFLALAVYLLVPFSAHASGHSEKVEEPRVAIVLASFGSTVKEARDTEADFVLAVRKRYPETHVVLANTARLVMTRNAEKGVRVPSLFRALADLADEGYTHVAVQSLQLIPGAEFEGVRAVAKAQEGLPKGLSKVSVGAPLFASNEDCEKAVDALIASLPKERKPGEPVIFVGHGTHHGVGGLAYPALQWHLANRDAKAFVSTIEGTPARDGTLALLGEPAGKNGVIWVAPLLGLAGDHAVNDLYGDEDDSWKSVLGKQGWQVKKAASPLFAIPGIRDIWFAHLDTALEALR
ncbi:MAG: sirohydrochlorin cobaltochelatase [Deltaproteobacteria bacterium]|nr:sirohydrochlorin cobaltochelatase [Deltaproteobacteria bacterium]